LSFAQVGRPVRQGSVNWNWKFAEKGAATLYWVGVHAAPVGDGSPVTTVLFVRRSVPLGERIVEVPTRLSELRGMTSAKAGVVNAKPRKLTANMDTM
jgi:hypothetical protein